MGYLLKHPENDVYEKCICCGHTQLKKVSMFITKDELLMGRDKKYPQEYTQEISNNLDNLLIVINKVRDSYGKPMMVTSGWRPADINAVTVGAAAHSNHTIGLAVDIADPVGDLRNYVLTNLALMQEIGMFFEDFNWTRSWVHFQIVAPKSGKRIFVPSSNPPTCDVWNQVYDHSFDIKTST